MPTLVSRGRGRRTINEINMVPFIDVMLVLLIIFMVTAPMLRPSKVDLPSVGATQRQEAEAVRVELDRAGQISVRRNAAAQAVPTAPDALIAAVQEQLTGRANVPVLIYADKELKYEEVMRTYDNLKKAGIQRIALAVKSK